jgi:hypothetical protein
LGNTNVSNLSGKIVSSESIHSLSGLPSNATPCYLRNFHQSKQPKSSFKSLLIVKSSFFQNQMSLNHLAVLEGLNRQDVERGNGSLQPPVSFVPDKSEDAEERIVQTLKIELANSVESRVAVWEGLGTPEQFMQQMIAMRDALEGMGLFKKYEESRKKVSDAKEGVSNEKTLHDMVIEQVETVVLETKKEPLCQEVAQHNEAIKVLQAAVATAKQERVAAMTTVFATTTNFFRGDGKAPWDRIIHEQTEKNPWTNHRGEEQQGVRGKTLLAWKDCYTSCSKQSSQTTRQSNKNFTLPC